MTVWRAMIGVMLLGQAAFGPARAEPILPPAAVPAPERACARDSDCVWLPAVCKACPPCAPTWRAVGNRAAAAARERKRQVVSCPSIKCARCASEKSWRGTKPICVQKLCTLEGQPMGECSQDSDCALDYSPAWSDPKDPCSCSRCGLSLPRAVPRRALPPQQPSKPCAPRPCPACEVKAPPPGLRAVCRDQRCALAATAPPARPDRACAKHSDCVFEPSRPCACSPCGETWRRAVNRTRAAAILAEDARRRCEMPRCAPCAKPLRWLGTEAVCIGGECATRGGLVIMRAP